MDNANKKIAELKHKVFLDMAGALDHLLSEGPHDFYARCLVVFVSSKPFFAFKELAYFCEGEYMGIAFPKKATHVSRARWM